MSDDGLFAYFEKLIEGIDHADLKIYLYHIPQVSGVGLSIDLVRRLYTAFPGAELPVIEAVKLGAPGCISATANLNSADIAKVIDLCHAGEWDAAEAAHEPVKAVRMLFQDYAPIPAQKALLAQQSGDPRWANLRPPFMPVSDEKRDSLAADLRPYGMNVG